MPGKLQMLPLLCRASQADFWVQQFKPTSGMKDESSRLAAQPVRGFQRGLCPQAAMGQRCGLKWGLRGCWNSPRCSQPPSYGKDCERGIQEELELGCHVAVSYPISPLIFMAHVGFAGFLGARLSLEAPSAPPRLWLAAAGGGEASVPAVAAFARQVLARRASVLGEEGEVSCRF